MEARKDTRVTPRVIALISRMIRNVRGNLRWNDGAERDTLWLPWPEDELGSGDGDIGIETSFSDVV